MAELATGDELLDSFRLYASNGKYTKLAADRLSCDAL